MKVKIYPVKNRPLTISEILKESGFKITEYEMALRLGKCECGSDSWILLPVWSGAVKDGGKRYMNCVNCGLSSHL